MVMLDLFGPKWRLLDRPGITGLKLFHTKGIKGVMAHVTDSPATVVIPYLDVSCSASVELGSKMYTRTLRRPTLCLPALIFPKP